MTNLRPCPFCGREAETVRAGNMYYVQCGNSDCPVVVETNNYYAEEEAISAWNTRETDNEIEQNRGSKTQSSGIVSG